MFNRKETIYHGDEIISQTLIDINWNAIRTTRKRVLNECDWRFMSDLNATQDWVDYRQFLRDLPQNFTEANDAADAWNEYESPK